MTYRCKEISGVLVLFGVITFASPAWASQEENTAQALIEVKSKRPSVVFNLEESDAIGNYKRYQQTQIQKIKSHFVLTAALRDCSLLPAIRVEKNKIVWLIDRLDIGFAKDSEILVITMVGDEPTDELLGYVKAVTNAYMKVVVDQDRQNKFKILDGLKAAKRKVDREISMKTQRYIDQAATLKAKGSHGAKIESDIPIHQLKLNQERRAQIRAKLDDVHLRALSAENNPDRSSQRSTIEIENKFWTDKLEELESEIAELTEAGMNLNQRDAELEMLQEEIEHLRAVQVEMGTRILQWEIENDAPPRITVIEPPHTIKKRPAKKAK